MKMKKLITLLVLPALLVIGCESNTQPAPEDKPRDIPDWAGGVSAEDAYYGFGMSKLNNNKIFKVIGIMSGTSVDGIDFSFIETNGTNYVKTIIGTTYEYNTKYRAKIKKFIKQLNNNN